MLKELKLSNFRLIDDEVTVRFRPITVLIGRNNSGKSSVIHFLKMLQRSLRPKGRFLSAEESNGSGTLWDLKNRKTRKRTLRFSLTVEANGRPSDAISGYVARWNKEKGEGIDCKKLDYATQAEVTYGKTDRVIGKTQRVRFGNGEAALFSADSPIVGNSSFLKFDAGRAGAAGRIVLDDCVGQIRLDLKQIRNVSAVRDGLRAAFSTARSSRELDRYVGAQGEFTLQEFYRSVFPDARKMRFFGKHAKRILGIDKVDFLSTGSSAECIATSSQTKAKVNIAHYGLGVRQCMPFFTQGLLSYPDSHLLVEQPEVGVHPTEQLELGSFISDLWATRKVGTIVETHSANLLLRLRRLVASGDFNPDDISVAYFSVDKGKATVTNLDIGSLGILSPDIPMMFFGADIIEVLEMNAQKKLK